MRLGGDAWNVQAPAGVPINCSVDFGYKRKMPLFITVSTFYSILFNNLLYIFSFMFVLFVAIEGHCCCEWTNGKI